MLHYKTYWGTSHSLIDMRKLTKNKKDIEYFKTINITHLNLNGASNIATHYDNYQNDLIAFPTM